jgi:hypothetical protein
MLARFTDCLCEASECTVHETTVKYFCIKARQWLPSVLRMSAAVINLHFFSGPAAERGLWPRSRGFLITHNDAPQSVGLLWTIDQSVAETST